MVPEPLVNDLPIRIRPPHEPGARQLAADLVYPLPRRDAGPVGELVVAKRARAGTYRLDDAITMAAGLHDGQYAALWSRLHDTSPSSRIAGTNGPFPEDTHNP